MHSCAGEMSWNWMCWVRALEKEIVMSRVWKAAAFRAWFDKIRAGFVPWQLPLCLAWGCWCLAALGSAAHCRWGQCDRIAGMDTELPLTRSFWVPPSRTRVVCDFQASFCSPGSPIVLPWLLTVRLSATMSSHSSSNALEICSVLSWFPSPAFHLLCHPLPWLPPSLLLPFSPELLVPPKKPQKLKFCFKLKLLPLYIGLSCGF